MDNETRQAMILSAIEMLKGAMLLPPGSEQVYDQTIENVQALLGHTYIKHGRKYAPCTLCGEPARIGRRAPTEGKSFYGDHKECIRKAASISTKKSVAKRAENM